MQEAKLVQLNPAVVVKEVTMTYTTTSIGQRATTDSTMMSRILGDLRRTRRTSKVHALHALSLVAGQGETIGVIGRNGSGKSTLMRIIAGQEIPTTGTVLATSPPVAIGVSAALVPSISGAENIQLGCLAMGMSNREIEDKFKSIADLAGLGESLNRPMKSYSSGMAARLRFAISTALDPEILILDEALNTGDAEFGERTRKRMNEIRLNAGCVFLVSHSMSTIQDMCTRALWIDKGELLYDGNPTDVVNLYEKFIYYLKREDHTSVEKMKRAARRQWQRVEILERPQGRRSGK